MKDKKVMIGGALMFVAAFWFYIKPNYMDSKPPPVFTEAQIAAAAKPTVFLGKSNAAAGGHGGAPSAGAAPDGLILNLKAPASSPAYAKVIMALEFADPDKKYVGVKESALATKNAAYAHELEPEMHKILDSVTSVFGSKSPDDVASTEGRDHLKEQLIEAINEHLHGKQVIAIYFETFITQ